MLDLLPYLPHARYLPDLGPEVAYAVRPSFFYGSSRRPEPGQLREQAALLTNPGFVRKQQALSLAVAGHEPAMLRYYADVLRVMKQHRKEIVHCRSYFALRPVLLSKGQAVLSFPWYDTYSEAASLLRALQVPLVEGLLFDDMDQGWEVAVYARSDRVYLAEGDGDRGKPHFICCTDRARFGQLAAATLARVQQQIGCFVRETGENPWRYTA